MQVPSNMKDDQKTSDTEPAGAGAAAGSLPRMGVRHLQAGLLFLATLLSYGMRVNLSVAIVAMTDEGFQWSVQTQSVVLSSFFWGYVVLQVPAGVLANRVGGRILLLCCMSVNTAATLLLPVAATYGGWPAVCACRVLQGLTQGALYPALHHLIPRWFPEREKSALGTFIYAGGQLGTALQLAASGVLAAGIGWPAIFYTDGALAAAWTIAYFFLGADSPESSTLISQEEREYITGSVGHVQDSGGAAVPWRAIWTSAPFWALVIVHSGQNWGFWTLMTEMPSYFRQVLGVDIRQNGAMSALPYLVMFLLSFPLGVLVTWCLRRRVLSVTAARKLSNTVGLWGPAAALVAVGAAPPAPGAALALLCVAVGLNAGHYTGFLLVHTDMSPRFAGTLMGITNGVSNVMSIIAPLAAGALLRDETDPGEWQKVFYLSAAVYVVANLVFVIFGSSVRQSWDRLPDDKLPEETTKYDDQVI